MFGIMRVVNFEFGGLENLRIGLVFVLKFREKEVFLKVYVIVINRVDIL